MDIKINWKNATETRYLFSLAWNGVDYYGLCATFKDDKWYLFEPNSEVGDRKYKYYRFERSTKDAILNAFLDKIGKKGE